MYYIAGKFKKRKSYISRMGKIAWYDDPCPLQLPDSGHCDGVAGAGCRHDIFENL
jgi:hypothetical protein